MSPREEPPPGSAAWIDAALRDRLGPEATAGELRFEGRALHVRGARVPLGPVAIEIDHAELELGAGAELGPYPISARLVSLRATLSAPSIGLRAPLSFTADAPAPRWISGTLRLGEVSLGGRPATLTARLDLDAGGLSLREGWLAVGPVSAALSGGARRLPDASLQGDLTLASEGTRLALALAVDAAQRLAGTRITGRLDLAEILALGFAGLDLDLAVPPRSLLDLDLAAEGDLSSPSLSGRAFASTLAIGRVSRPGSALRLEDASALVHLDRRRLRYRGLEARAHGARLAGWGRVPLGAPRGDAASVPLLALSVEQAGPALLLAASPLTGAALPARAIPADLSISGEIMLAHDLAVSLAAAAFTPRSHLRARVSFDADGTFRGSTLRGHLAVADAITAGLFSGPVRPRPPAVLDIDARLTGSLSHLGLAGRVESAGFLLDVFADPARPSFLVEEASALLDVDGVRIAWHRLTGRVSGGSLTSSGRYDFASGALESTVGFRGVRVEQIPTQAEGASRLAGLLEGAASGEITIHRHPLPGALVGARGRVALADPRYLFVRRLAPDLARYGLPAVRSRGAGPLTALVHFDGAVLRVQQLTAALTGVDVKGDVELALDGRLGGAALLVVREAYLRQSPLLAVPAALAGRIEIPVELAGTAGAPVIRTDARAILERMMAENPVRSAVKSVVDRVAEIGARGRKKR